jgi:hypothetical protein
MREAMESRSKTVPFISARDKILDERRMKISFVFRPSSYVLYLVVHEVLDVSGQRLMLWNLGDHCLGR